MSGEEPDGEYLTVSSELSAVGSYMCQIGLGDRPLRVLDRDQAAAYVAEMTWAIVCGEYDAAVLAQLKSIDIPMPEVGAFLRDLRGQRRPILAAATAPLVLTPIVAARDLVARMTVSCAGLRDWQWEMWEVRQHAAQVAEVSAGVDMDAAYLRQLRSIGVGGDAARAYVMALRDHLPGMTDVMEPPRR